MQYKWMRPALACLLWGCTTHYYKAAAGQVGIYLKAPEAASVMLVPSFNGYQPLTAEHTGTGTWVVKVPSGISFSYFYLVDHRPTVPQCEMTEQDEFGRSNCVFSPIRNP
jgi:hypothetical protein